MPILSPDGETASGRMASIPLAARAGEVHERLGRSSNSQPAAFSMSYTNPANTYHATRCREAAR
jgi:hypothetical protein